MTADARVAFTREAIEEFLYHEAQLLDDARYDEWLALFLPDCVYWVPARPDQTDPVDEVSLVYDDLPLLQARVAQLRHPAHLANVPAVRAIRQISNISLAPQVSDPSRIVVRSKLLMVESRSEQQRLFGGTVRHELRALDGGLRIASKTIVLVNCDGPIEEFILPF